MISAEFIEALNKADAQLPWDTDAGQVIDAEGYLVCACVGSHGQLIAEMIVLAVNACGSFRATRRD